MRRGGQLTSNSKCRLLHTQSAQWHLAQSGHIVFVVNDIDLFIVCILDVLIFVVIVVLLLVLVGCQIESINAGFGAIVAADIDNIIVIVLAVLLCALPGEARQADISLDGNPTYIYRLYIEFQQFYSVNISVNCESQLSILHHLTNPIDFSQNSL